MPENMVRLRLNEMEVQSDYQATFVKNKVSLSESFCLNIIFDMSEKLITYIRIQHQYF